jgi:5-carboxymethyl-2-hydroxymuconate isomerase
MTGTDNQVEWAERIRVQVNAEFERVASAFRVVEGRQTEARRIDTEAILAILEEKRSAVTKREEAGYYIREWQEMSDRVRRMIFDDPRYQEIKAGWAKGAE